MKTSKLFLLFLTATALVLTNCGKDGDKVNEKPSYSITVTDNGLGTASAMVGSTAASTAKQGTTVTLTATPKEGYVFDRWTIESGGITLSPDATSNPATFTMPAAAVNVKAEFKELEDPEYSITVTDNGLGTASATVDGVAASTAVEGATVTLTATPKEGSVFDRWTIESGGITLSPDATSNPATFTMPAEAVNVKAEFKKPSYSITVTDNGLGTASATVDGVAASTAVEGATVTLTATPNKDYAFDRWTIESGGITLSPDATSNPVTFTMPATAVSVKAEFVEIGVMINGIVWAKYNVDAPGTFVAKPEDYGMFYQWNRKKAWPATGEVTGWDTTMPSGDRWEPANDPCPEGWRIPTKEEQATLLAFGKVTNEVVTLNGVDCRKFTDVTSGESVFLPFARLRDSSNGSLSFTGNLKGGFYWTSSLFSEGQGWGLNFVNDNIAQYNSVGTYGFTVRCIHE